MIRPCTPQDFGAIASIINEAAEKYRGVIPAEHWHEPYMSDDTLRAEIAAGVAFSGWEDEGGLVGVMGIQRVRDATLIRHAYVRTGLQGRGIGGRLLEDLAAKATGRLLVGTWAAASWAIGFYQAHRFQLASPEEKARLLKSYWTVSPEQAEVSVVLERVSS